MWKVDRKCNGVSGTVIITSTAGEVTIKNWLSKNICMGIIINSCLVALVRALTLATHAFYYQSRCTCQYSLSYVKEHLISAQSGKQKHSVYPTTATLKEEENRKRCSSWWLKNLACSSPRGAKVRCPTQCTVVFPSHSSNPIPAMHSYHVYVLL